MADLQQYCNVAGVCWDVTREFLRQIPWNVVLKELVTVSGKKAWSNKNSFKLVLKEAEMAKQIYVHFKDTLGKLDQYQRDLNVSICSLETGKSFLANFEKVLEIYDPRDLSTWEKYGSGDALRQQLQYYLAYMHSIISNIHLEISYVTLQLQTIQMENDPMRRSILIRKLKTGCRRRQDAMASASPMTTSEFDDDVYTLAPESFAE